MEDFEIIEVSDIYSKASTEGGYAWLVGSSSFGTDEPDIGACAEWPRKGLRWSKLELGKGL